MTDTPDIQALIDEAQRDCEYQLENCACLKCRLRVALETAQRERQIFADGMVQRDDESAENLKRTLAFINQAAVATERQLKAELRAEAAEADLDRLRTLARRAVERRGEGDDDHHHAMDDLETALAPRPSGEVGPDEKLCPICNQSTVGCPHVGCPFAQGDAPAWEDQLCRLCGFSWPEHPHNNCVMRAPPWAESTAESALDGSRVPASPPPDRGERWKAAKLTNVDSNTAWTVYEMATRTHFVPGVIQVHGPTPRHDAETLARSLSEVEQPLVCHAARSDGECIWPLCPQEADGEPGKTGRSCPLARDEDGERVFYNSELGNLRSEAERLRGALSNLLDWAMRNTCQHEETHRGGVIWEICDGCGAKWADDEGGKPDWVDPPEWQKAEAALQETDDG